MREPSAWDYDDQGVVEVKNEAGVARSRTNLYVAKDTGQPSYDSIHNAVSSSASKVAFRGIRSGSSGIASDVENSNRNENCSDSNTTDSDSDTTHESAASEPNPNPNLQPNPLLSQNSFSFTDVTQAQKPLAEAFQPLQHIEARQVKYKPPALRGNLQECLASQRGSATDVHCEDTLRRVSVVVHRHILICERRKLARERRNHAEDDSRVPSTILRRSRKQSREAVSAQLLTPQLRGDGDGMELGVLTGEESSSTPRSGASGDVSMRSSRTGRTERTGSKSRASVNESESEEACALLCEDNYLRTYWKYTFLQLPRLPLWTPHRIERIERRYEVPSVERIYNFLHNIFTEADLSSECCVISLIYVERLMERSGLELLSSNWHPVLLCCMLLASKVWQDLSSWNVEFARICPQYSNKSINKMERNVLQLLKWDLFISGSLYAKYYFALRSLSESRNFRRRYNYIMRVNHNKIVEEKSAQVASDLYSKSM